jgi:hypothetical protein
MYNLYLVVKEFNIEISTAKTKIMAFQRKERAGSKIFTEHTIFEQVNSYVCSCLFAGVTGSNPAQGMDVCLLCCPV